jgi:hypothetical protein
LELLFALPPADMDLLAALGLELELPAEEYSPLRLLVGFGPRPRAAARSEPPERSGCRLEGLTGQK